MVISKVSEELISLTVSVDELAFLSNAINETLASLEDWEFQTRTATTRDQAVELHRQLLAALGQRPPMY